MALKRGIHSVVQLANLAGVEADQMGTKLFETCAHARCIRGQIKRTKRADLAPTGKSLGRLDLDHGAVEDRHRLPARPIVASFVKRKVDLIRPNRFDAHLALS